MLALIFINSTVSEASLTPDGKNNVKIKSADE